MFALAQLYSLSALGSGAIDTNVKPVVLCACAKCSHPNQIVTRGLEVDIVRENGHLPRLIHKIDARSQLVGMRGSRVREDFNLGFAASRGCVVAIAILDIHPAIAFGNPIRGPSFRERLGCIVFSLNQDNSVGLVIVASHCRFKRENRK